MPRVHVWVPDELMEQVRERLPQVNFSLLLQQGLRGSLGCGHHELACRQCAEPIDRWALVDAALGRFYRELLGALDELVARGGTAEGAARVAKDTAGRHQISAAELVPLPRPARAKRAGTRREIA